MKLLLHIAEIMNYIEYCMLENAKKSMSKHLC